MPAPDPAITLDPVSATIAIQGMNACFQEIANGLAHYAENVRYDYLVSKARVDYAQATAIRHVEESGSGRVRTLDASNTAPAKAV